MIIEVLCGEGVNFCYVDGICFMYKFDECGDFVLCDVVVCVIDYEMKWLGVDCMYLDISYKFVDFIVKYFFNIYWKCCLFGIDIICEFILVVFVVYYSCGGVMIDFNVKIDLNNVYVIGEVVYIGLYGVNCMVFNFLFECVVFVSVVVEDIIKNFFSVDCEEFIVFWDES